MAHELPALPYPANALEPYIDEQTMNIHHDRHHNTYVTNLNAALESAPALQNKSVEEPFPTSAAFPKISARPCATTAAATPTTACSGP